MIENLKALKRSLSGELHTEDMWRKIYATDASVYRELPLAVAFPKNKEDLKLLIKFANENKIGLIPRTAGTSLSGQCVGDGIVLDFSFYFNNILKLNAEEKSIWVEPAVVRDELNHFLKPHNLFFGPNTSTANRAMIGGMVGNNSCGSYSIVYGTTRDHVLELKGLLSDGSEFHFKAQDLNKRNFNSALEENILNELRKILSNENNAAEIRKEFPKPSIHRRNTGYALDELLNQQPFNPNGKAFNLSSFVCGSEGTLCLITAIKLNLNPLPPKKVNLICAHFNSVNAALKSTVELMQFKPRAIELMDKIVLDCTKENLLYKDHRFFIKGDPQAILIIEVGANKEEELKEKVLQITENQLLNSLSYAMEIVEQSQAKKVWDLRKAGLGLLANIPGDKKAVAVVEDTAVDLNDLPDYIEAFDAMMKSYKQQSVYYAHAGAGELHLRPILDLKQKADREDFKKIAAETAKLVKNFNGSLSGEHGDGRVRAPFLKDMIGAHNYKLLKQIKQTWDPNNIFNPGKIIDAKAIDANLRYEENQETPTFDTIFDWSKTQGILRAAEKCNGSGDCRKLAISGGTMCPSYMATKNEKDSTRARANVLREVLTQSKSTNKFNSKDLLQTLDLCLSCKGCTAECPSNVDMAALKAEAYFQYYKSNPVPLRSRVFGSISQLNKLLSKIAALNNFLLDSTIAKKMLKQFGIAEQRSLPLLANRTLRQIFKKEKNHICPNKNTCGKVILFADEFTNFYDVSIGTKSIMLLNKLGFEVEMPAHQESGRAALSKGLLKSAKKFAEQNVQVLSKLVSPQTPLIGIEPSAILTFRDEYPKLVDKKFRKQAEHIAQNCFLIDEFLHLQIETGKLNASLFTKEKKEIFLHGHCHQKALSDANKSLEILSIPENASVEMIPSGCCGMAGSFGYEAEHYEVSMKIGELVLFPKVRQLTENQIVAAPGTSCRHQIFDGTKRKAFHPVEILVEMLAL